MSRLKKKHPKLKKFPVGWGVFGDRCWGRKTAWRIVNRPRVYAALEVLVDGSLNRVTLPKVGSLELAMQLCRNTEIPCLGSTLFFSWRTAQTGPPGGAVHTACNQCANSDFVPICLGTPENAGVM